MFDSYLHMNLLRRFDTEDIYEVNTATLAVTLQKKTKLKQL